jgi:hypothetical protein
LAELLELGFARLGHLAVDLTTLGLRLSVLEHVVEGLVHHENLEDIAHSLVNEGSDEILARTIMVIVTFIPFFSFLETDRVLGKGKLFALFFREGSSV